MVEYAPRSRAPHLEGATINGMNMLPILLGMGSVFFPLRVAPIGIKITLKDIKFENLPKSNYANVSLLILKWPNFDAANTKCFTVP